MKITTSRSLFEALDDRGSTAAERKAFDDEVWAQRGAEGAILVTDLSGFTRVTKEHGIVQFLALFRKFQALCGPTIEANGGQLLKQEADDLFGLFSNATQAISSAKNMLEKLREHNASALPEEQIGLSVGIDFGQYIRLTDDAYGDPVNVAFKLGEDIANRNEIRIGKSAYEQVKDSRELLSAFDLQGPVSVEASGNALEHYILTLKN